LAALAAASAWFTSGIGSIFAVSAQTAASARTLVRGIILVPLLLFAFAVRFGPEMFHVRVLQALDAPSMPYVLLGVALALAAAGSLGVRKTAAGIEELRHPISILG
jgi:hypothetical protein